jgi:hypothetical protein
MPHRFTPTQSPTDTMSTSARSVMRDLIIRRPPRRFLPASLGEFDKCHLSPAILLPLGMSSCAISGASIRGIKTVVKLEHVMTKTYACP